MASSSGLSICLPHYLNRDAVNVYRTLSAYSSSIQIVFLKLFATQLLSFLSGTNLSSDLKQKSKPSAHLSYGCSF